jgi:hypothetical protein
MNHPPLWFWEHVPRPSSRWNDPDDALMIARSVDEREDLDDEDVAYLKSLDEEGEE